MTKPIDVAEIKPCACCKRGVMHHANVIFYRVTIATCGANMDGIRQVHAMETMFAGNTATARALSPLDPKRFGKALDDHVNKPTVEADQKIASDKGISGTPTSVVNGYELGGAQPLAKWKRVIQKVLDEKTAPQGAQPAKR